MAEPRDTAPNHQPADGDGHPSPFRLEAWSVGEPDPGVDRHMESCKQCRGYVVSLEMDKEVFLDQEDPERYVRQGRRIADTEQRPVVGLSRPAPVVRPGPVEPEPGAADQAAAYPAPRKPWRARLPWWMAAPALTAVALVVGLVVQSLKPGPAPVAGAKPGSGTGTGTGTGSGPEEPGRGGPITLGALVSGKDKKQVRVSGMVYTTAGMQVRVELSVPRKMAVTVGILDASSEWIPLVQGQTFKQGVHVLPSSLAFNDRPTTARVIAGTPKQIAEAVKIGKFKGLPTLLIQPVRGAVQRPAPRPAGKPLTVPRRGM